MANVVKQIQQKTNDETPISYPIGVDSNFVDMQSILNLEEEIKIGGNKYTKISTQTDNSRTYILTEQYYASTAITGISSATTANITHTVLSYIKDVTSSINYTYPIEVEEIQHQTLGQGSTTIVSVDTFLDDGDKQIMINYYQGYPTAGSTAYHQKFIGIKNPSSGGSN